MIQKIIGVSIVFFLASCGGKSVDRKAELEKLKKERILLDNRIFALEAQVGSGSKESKNSKHVRVLEVSENLFRSYIEVQGRIDAEENVQVNAEVGGIITAIFSHVGQQVAVGQILAQVDDLVLRQNKAELQNQLELAKTLYERQKNLWDQKIGTEVQYLNAKTQKEGFERRIATLNSQESMYKIKSPIAGTVDAMDLKIGQAVMPGISAIRVINTNKLKAKALLSESYAGQIHRGDQLDIIFPDIRDTVHTTLSFASKAIDPLSRSFGIEAKLSANDLYHPNMLAIFKIIGYQHAKALTVPINAIQQGENTNYVFIAANRQAKRVLIQVGKVSENKAEVLAGLTVGDQVIIAGMQNLNEGDLVSF